MDGGAGENPVRVEAGTNNGTMIGVNQGPLNLNPGEMLINSRRGFKRIYPLTLTLVDRL